ncbi:dienelactone hydrolase family protein [Streptomyces sp. 8K308]|uniref:dienelactone hydrolase family protein n=1 Tax=Streptomyces sp. 8K308 TaxID=2530388 RepID=UPI001FB77A3E|nr:dienelactone hydrolase family protein [Streptomyces sp. 8K308]
MRPHRRLPQGRWVRPAHGGHLPGAGRRGGQLPRGRTWRPRPPDSPHLLADRITAELYSGHADQEATNPPEESDRLHRALSTAGVRHRAEVYAGAHHGFTQAEEPQASLASSSVKECPGVVQRP